MKKANEYDANFAKAQQEGTQKNEVEDDESKFIADCKLALEHTQALRQASANPQLLRPEDYVRLESFLLNVINRCTSPSHSCKSECTKKVDIRCDDDDDEDMMSCRDSLQSRVAISVKEKIDSKGFCSYVTVVASYVIFLFIVTLLLSRIGKI